MTGPQHGDRVWVFDVSSVVRRHYHGNPPQTSPTGQPVNAVVGWVRTLRRLRRVEKARWILPVFDPPGPGWRHSIFPAYKAGRPEQDADLVSQWPLVVGVTLSMRLPALAVPGFEADDLIAAYVDALVSRGCLVTIVSNDKDLLQLVRGEDGQPGSVRQLARGRDGDALRGPSEVRAKFGVGPELLADLLALAGDKGDGVPGVQGIGLKTAAELLTREGMGSLEAVLDRWALCPGRSSAAIRDGADAARLSRRLVGLRADTPLPVPLDRLGPIEPSAARLSAVFADLGYPRWESAVDAYEGYR